MNILKKDKYTIINEEHIISTLEIKDDDIKYTPFILNLEIINLRDDRGTSKNIDSNNIINKGGNIKYDKFLKDKGFFFIFLFS